MIDADDKVAVTDAGAADQSLRCPKCGKPVQSLRCGHCGSRLPSSQADLYGAVIRKLATMGGDRTDAGHQGGIADNAETVSNAVWASPGDDGDRSDTTPGLDAADQETGGNAAAPRRTIRLPELTDEERERRQAATTLLHGDAVENLSSIPDGSADVVLFDPPYPGIKRPYGMISEDEWHALMDSVLQQCRRILKPQSSVVMIIQPNYEVVGRMRLWPWKFVVRAAESWEDWGLIQDVYSFAPNAPPCGGVERSIGLLRTSVKWCVWLGPSDCYRNQDAVLDAPSPHTAHRMDNRQQVHPSGLRFNLTGIYKAFAERGGVTPRNLLAFPVGTPVDRQGHPAVTQYRLAEWWCRYLLPPNGILIDPFCGSGTTLAAALNCGASRVIGIDKEQDYLELAQRRVLDDPPGAEDDPASHRSFSWPIAPDPFALERVEEWKGGSLTESEEAMRRFFRGKSWLVGGPIPLRLLYSQANVAVVETGGQDDHFLSDIPGLTEQMVERGIPLKYHRGLALLFLQLCRGVEISADATGLAT